MPGVPQCPCGVAVSQCQCQATECDCARLRVEYHAAVDWRTCSRCERSRPVDTFPMRPNGVTRQSWCRDCAASHARARRAARPAGATPRRVAGALDAERRFGVEIEHAGISRYVACDALIAAGLECVVVDSYGDAHAQRSTWKIVPDSSVESGQELVSPILSGAEGRRQVLVAMRALRDAGATVNRSCGLHVHHDAQDLTAGALARLVHQWHDAQEVTDGLVAPSRRGGMTWCWRLDATDLARADRFAAAMGSDAPVTDRRDAMGYLAGDRYRTLNLQAYGRQGSVEVRQHQGTLNATKALAWIAYGQAMIARAKSGPAAAPLAARDLLESLTAHGLDSITHAYLTDRSEAFAGQRITA